jgi:hypothetical protein
MKNKSILNLIKEATSNAEYEFNKFVEASGMTIGTEEGNVSKAEALGAMDSVKEYVHALFTRTDSEGNRMEVPNVDLAEMLTSSDSSGVFKRVISEILVKPKEPALFLSNNVAKQVTLDAKAPLTVTFPVVGAYQAFPVGEGQEYRQQVMTMQEHIASLRLGKVGVMASLTEEVVEHSIYPLINLNLELMANGINRYGEELCYKALTQKAQEVFNNDTGVSAERTSGVDVGQVWNGSVALKDILTMAGVVVGNRYEPSHMLIHPLAYHVIFQDPLIRSTFFHQGQIGSGIHRQLPKFDQGANMPFGLSYVPYYALPYQESGVMASHPGSGFASALLTDIYVIDSANSMTMLSRGDIEIDSMDDWFKDATTLKARKYMAVAGMDGGKGMTVARNVRVVENFTPIMTVRNTV